MPIRKQLPARARVDQLKKQAKDLLTGVRAGDAVAMKRVAESHPRRDLARAATVPAKLLLADAELVIAREYGFASWTKLRRRVEAIDFRDPVTVFTEAACIPMDGSWHGSGTLNGAQAILAEHPHVAEHDIYTAAILGNDGAVRRFLEKGGYDGTATGGLYDWDALTYLSFSRYLRLDPARSEGFVRSARLLLEHGASAQTGFYSQDHQPEPCFESVIYGAAGVARHAELTRLLLERGADPNDETAYHVPESLDNTVLKLLVESGKINRMSMTTMLHRKLDWHDYDGVAWLLAHGADPNEMSYWAKRALHKSLERDNPLRMVELLLESGADPLLLTASGRSAIAMAARLCRADALDAFARRGFPIELGDADAFLAACARGDASFALAAIALAPAIVAELERDEPSLLANVAGAGNRAAVELMLDLGFNVASRTGGADARDDTALHVAIWRGRNEIAKLLLARGAPLDVTNGRGETPLALAARAALHSDWTRARTPEMVEALLAAGADVRAVKSFPLGNDALDELLRRHGR
jgi:ankyrin repeat protein